jgi:hypothetical protein
MTMRKSDAAELLAFTAAFDQRTIGHADVEAWALALADVPWDDTARQAIADFYGTAGGYPATGERRFIQPHNVRAGRSRIRNDRLARIVEPPPNVVEGVRSYEEVRALRKAIADGEIPDQAAADRYTAWGGSLHLLHQQRDGIDPGDGPREIA